MTAIKRTCIALLSIFCITVIAFLTACTYDSELIKFTFKQETPKIFFDNEVSEPKVDVTEYGKDFEVVPVTKPVIESESITEIEPDIEEEYVEYSTDESYYEDNQYESYQDDTSYSSNYFKNAGVVYGSDGTRYTWYSQNILPGGGLTALNNNGRHVDGNGYVCDGDGYIAVASPDYAQGTILDTPFGPAKVYDTGCASGTVDIYTNF